MMKFYIVINFGYMMQVIFVDGFVVDVVFGSEIMIESYDLIDECCVYYEVCGVEFLELEVVLGKKKCVGKVIQMDDVIKVIQVVEEVVVVVEKLLEEVGEDEDKKIVVEIEFVVVKVVLVELQVVV